jgi:hypothetical protein
VTDRLLLRRSDGGHHASEDSTHERNPRASSVPISNNSVRNRCR